jgi:chromate transporter
VAVALAAATYGVVRFSFGADPFDGVAELFSSAAFVSFGGAYALLPYVADRAVESFGWLNAEQMLNGLALAESTPGPLILVNVYAGFFAGWSDPAGMAPATAAMLTGALACFYTFAPSFMMILALAPYVERAQQIAWARRALAGVSAAVVGVILNLAVYLGEAAFFPTGLDSASWPKIALCAGFFALSFIRPLSMLTLVGLGAASGLALGALGLV